MQFSVVIPVYNEEEVIRLSYARLKNVMDAVGDYELIFVDDGSRDATLRILKEIASEDKNVRVIGFSRNFGHQEAVSAGLRHAAGRAIVVIDADLQDPPELIPQMIEAWRQGADIVYGRRVKREGESLVKKATAWAFYRVLHALGAQKVPRDTGDFRLIDRKVADVMNAMPEKNRFLRGMSAWAGFAQQPVEYVREARAAGKTKYTLKKMLKLAGDGITAFSSRPLKLPLVLGCATGLLAFVYLVVSIVLWSAGICGYAHFVFSLLFLLIAAALVSIGVMGIYIGRIYDEAKNRPLYVISEKINFDA